MSENTRDEQAKGSSVEKEAEEVFELAERLEAGSEDPPKPGGEPQSESEPDSEPEPESGPEGKSKRRIKPLDKKLPEHPDGLAKRSEWFRKRRGEPD